MGTRIVSETKQWIKRLGRWMRYKIANLCYNKTSAEKHSAPAMYLASEGVRYRTGGTTPVNIVQQWLDSATVRQSPLSSFFIRIVNAASVAEGVIS